MDKPYFFHGHLVGTISENGRITLTPKQRMDPYIPPRVELMAKTPRAAPTPAVSVAKDSMGSTE